MPTLTSCPTHLKTLVLVRGLPSYEKSAFIQKHGLEPFAVNPEQLRGFWQLSLKKRDEKLDIHHARRAKKWNPVYDSLETRLKKGEFTVVDVTYAEQHEFNVYKNVAEKNGYRLLCVDFQHVSLQETQNHNQNASSQEQTSERLIENAYKQMQTLSLPQWLETVHPNDYKEAVSHPPIDFSHYRKIHMIGDIHGCYDALMSFMPKTIPDDELFIFLGDYINKGVQNVQTLTYLFKHMHHPNFIFLEGNHETHLWRWANGLPSYNKRDFERHTKPELENGLIDKKTARVFYRKLKQVLHFSYGEKEVLATHGGLPAIPSDLHTISSEQFIRGIGEYTMDIDEAFAQNSEPHQYQVHGHRNLFGRPLLANDKSFNLEGQIDKGGFLRIVTLDANGFTPAAIRNETVSLRFEFSAQAAYDSKPVIKSLPKEPVCHEKRTGRTSASISAKREPFSRKEPHCPPHKRFIRSKSNDIA